METPPPLPRKPDWLRTRLESGQAWQKVTATLQENRLHTVCEEARCPNIAECWSKHGTATFMILGDTCTRRCRFCKVKTGLPAAPDLQEPARVADAAAAMGLRHVVVTMVTRDDLPDGGATVLASTVKELRKALPGAGIEVLASDMMGNPDAIDLVLEAGPDIMSHNLETVRRLTPRVRSRSDYQRSLDFLARCAAWAKSAGAGPAGRTMQVKSSLMLGLGEEEAEVLEALDDLAARRVELVNLGQYLQPSHHHLPVLRWWTPEEFDQLKAAALARGFLHVEAGPLVRSSYHAAVRGDHAAMRVFLGT